MKHITQIFLEGESPTLNFFYDFLDRNIDTHDSHIFQVDTELKDK